MDKLHDLFWDTLHHNGWRIDVNDSDFPDLDTYTMGILLQYKCKCYARIATREEHLDMSGKYGVQWIDTVSEVKPPYDCQELKEMEKAIELAEQNLLTIGVPFKSNYEFHGKTVFDVIGKKKRNDVIREEWGCKQLEDEWKRNITEETT